MVSAEHKRDLKYSNDFPWQEKDNFDQEEAEIKAQDSATKTKINGLGELIHGWSLKWYKDVALWPMFILLIIELGAQVIQTKYLPLLNEEIFNYIIIGARVILFGYLAIVAVKQFKATKIQAIIAAVIGGFVAGFILAVFQLFWYFELWTFFNIIGQPLLMALYGIAVVWVVVSLLRIKD